MPAVKLTELQEEVLALVCMSAPHAVPNQVAATLRRPTNNIQVALDALTRRGLVTPIGTWGKNGAIYVATAKGKLR